MYTRIDAHVHVTPPEIIASWQSVAEREPYFSLLSHSKSNRFATVEDVVAELDRCGYHKAVVFSFAFADMGLCRLVNDYVMDGIRRFPDRLMGFQVIPPTAPSEALSRELRRCIDGGLQGVGELFPEGQRWDIADKSATAPLAGLCEEAGLPVLVHGNEPVGHYYAGKTGDTPRRLATLAENHPQLRFIFAHWGGGLLFYEAMPEMRRILQNVSYDTAATPYLYRSRIYDMAKAAGLMDKVIFGSDFPLLSPARHTAQVEESRLDEKDIRLLYGENILHILNGSSRKV